MAADLEKNVWNFINMFINVFLDFIDWVYAIEQVFHTNKKL